MGRTGQERLLSPYCTGLVPEEVHRRGLARENKVCPEFGGREHEEIEGPSLQATVTIFSVSEAEAADAVLGHHEGGRRRAAASVTRLLSPGAASDQRDMCFV